MTGNVYLSDKCKYVYILFFFILIMNGKFIKAETMIIDDMRNANNYEYSGFEVFAKVHPRFPTSIAPRYLSDHFGGVNKLVERLKN